MHVELGVTKKKFDWLFFIKAAWIVATVSVLLIGLGACLGADDLCFEARLSMQGFMLLLSFPSSILFFVWVPMFVGWESIHSPVDYILIWMGAFVVGYLQWFVLVPRLLAEPEFTTLGLARTSGSKRHRKPRVRALPAYGMKAFDKQGKSPIERVFSSHGK